MRKIIVVVFIILGIFSYSLTMNNYNNEQHVYAYSNHCWKCKSSITDKKCVKYEDCEWYICADCGACNIACKRIKHKMPLRAIDIIMLSLFLIFGLITIIVFQKLD